MSGCGASLFWAGWRGLQRSTWEARSVATWLVVGQLRNDGQGGNGPNVRHKIMDVRNLRQIGQAALIYALENKGRLPENNLGVDGTPAEDEMTTVHRYAISLARNWPSAPCPG